MKDIHSGLIVLMVMVLGALGACSGSTVPAGPTPGPADQLTYQLTLSPESTVDVGQVEGDAVTAQEALAAHGGTGLPPDFDSVQGMYFAPEVEPGAGFSGAINVELEDNHATSQVADGTLLFLYYAPTTGGPAQFVASARASGGWASFPVTMLGYFVITTNSTIPAVDDVFIAHAFADRAAANVGEQINCWAVAQNGQAPYTLGWDMGDGTVLAGDRVAHAYTTNGEYTVRVTVTDSAAVSISAFSTPVTITGGVVPIPLAVTATATPDFSDYLLFNFGANVTGGQPPYAYEWDLDGDGTIDSNRTSPTWTYPAAGLYACSVTVTDDANEQASAGFVADARWLTITGAPASGTDPLDVDFELTADGFIAGDIIALVFGDGEDEDIAFVAGQTLYQTTHIYTEGNYTAQAAGTTNLNATDYVIQSNQLAIDVASPSTLPFIQFTEPVLPQAGQNFLIRGFNFGADRGARRVMLGDRELTVVTWTETMIEVQYPLDFTPPQALLVIEDPSGKPSPSVVLVTMQVQPWPQSVQTVLPLEPEPGARILIIGHGLGTTLGTVSVDSTPATVESWNTQCVVAMLDAGTPTGNQIVRVTAGGTPLEVSATVVTATGQPYPTLATATPNVQEFGLGATMNLAGINFGDGAGGLVAGNAMTFPVNTWTTTQVYVGDPPQPFDGDVVVLNRGYVSGPLSIAYMFRPVIDDLTPDFGAIGDTFIVNGQYFGTQLTGERVTLGDAPLAIDYWQDDEISVTLPAGVDDGNVLVEKRLLSNGVAFDVVPQPPEQPAGGQI